jgi:hypothetical protein
MLCCQRAGEGCCFRLSKSEVHVTRLPVGYTERRGSYQKEFETGLFVFT